MNFKFSVVKYFGPSIMKVEMPKELINILNKYVDEILLDDKKKSELNHGEFLIGDVTQEFKLENDFIHKSGWGNFLVTCVKKWIEIENNQTIKEFKIKNSWIVRQFKNEYNPTHWHAGHISGAGFLKVPKSLGISSQKKNTKPYFGGNLQLIHGSKMFLSNSLLSIEPKVGDFYFFPNYLMHCVFPFKDSNEERRSISFNALIDENIYNVYGN